MRSRVKYALTAFLVAVTLEIFFSRVPNVDTNSPKVCREIAFSFIPTKFRFIGISFV